MCGSMEFRKWLSSQQPYETDIAVIAVFRDARELSQGTQQIIRPGYASDAARIVVLLAHRC